jgi:uncharacterized repeat protein (TIGR03803 family)
MMPQTAALAVRTNSTHYKVGYSFGAPPDGNEPLASLIDVGGVLYGKTREGGSHTCYDPTSSFHFSCGTVFSITTGGTEKVLHSFSDRPDGAQPLAGLIDVKGKLYGTTAQGGTYGYGTVFALTP